MPESVCPECGAPITEHVEGGSLVITCTQCSLEAVTTDPDAPFNDTTKYTVGIVSAETPLSETAASVAVALGISAVDALELLNQGLPLATDIHALEVQRLHKFLKPLGLLLSIEPEFKWELD